MENPIAGLAEMARVTRQGGVVAACVRDHAGDYGPLSLVREAVGELDPEAENESHLAGAREGDLAKLFLAAELREVEDGTLSVSVEHPTFEDWWDPFTLGVGPAGAYVAGLDSERREQLREHCRQRLPTPPFVLSARAWAVRGRP
jgi:hypothetical protein